MDLRTINDYLIYNGIRHIVDKMKVPEYFTIIQDLKDDVIKVHEHKNLDDPNRHNVAGALNRPDRAAEAKKERGEI